MKFAINQLQDRSGTTTFAKGRALFQSNCVRNLQIKEKTVSAIVEGSISYHVQLTTTAGDEILCRCSGPAAEYQDVCKHCIAVALKANTVPAESESDRDKIKKYLQQYTHAELVESLLGFIEKDETDWNNWLLKTKLEKYSMTFSQLENAVMNALPIREIYDWQHVGNYFHNAEQQIGKILSAMQVLPVDEQWELVCFIMERLTEALESIDDSNGERLPLEERLDMEMTALFNALDWDDEKKAYWLLENLKNPVYEFFPVVSASSVTSESVRQLFLKLCYQKLEEECSREKNKSAHWNAELFTYSQPLIKAARIEKNWQKEININAMLAQSSHDYLALCKSCLEHEQTTQAQSWLTKAREVAKSQYEKLGCDRHELYLLEAAGKFKQAWALANAIFQAAPSYSQYRDVAARQKKWGIKDEQFLTRIEKKFKENCKLSKPPYAFSRHNDDLAEFYLEQKRFDEAYSFAMQNPMSLSTMEKLAKCMAAKEPQKHLELYMIVISTHIEQTNNSAYEQALRCLQTVEAELGKHPDVLQMFYEKVKLLSAKYKNKRNMQRLLMQHYAQYI